MDHLVMKQLVVLVKELLERLVVRLVLHQVCLVVIMNMVKLNQASLEGGKDQERLNLLPHLDQVAMHTTFQAHQDPQDGRDHQDQMDPREKEVYLAEMVLLEQMVYQDPLAMSSLFHCRDQMEKVQITLRLSGKCSVNICLP